MTFDLSPRPLNPAPPAPGFPWPEGKRSALFISFDVDAETAWIGNDPSNVDRLVTVSHGGYGPRAGVPKILQLLDSLGIKATFFIPGWTVEAHTAVCESILKAGHEVAHHGYLHKLPEPSRPEDGREEIDRGLEALKSRLGVVPVGYRAPSGENTPELLAYLTDRGLRYSSSFRDDYRPYRHRLQDGRPGTVEIPVEFNFDDWRFGLACRQDPRPLFGREAVLPLWRDMFAGIHDWGGVSTLVLHPQVSGRPMRWHILRDFLTEIVRRDDVWIATGAEIAAHYEACEAAAR